MNSSRSKPKQDIPSPTYIVATIANASNGDTKLNTNTVRGEDLSNKMQIKDFVNNKENFYDVSTLIPIPNIGSQAEVNSGKIQVNVDREGLYKNVYIKDFQVECYLNDGSNAIPVTTHLGAINSTDLYLPLSSNKLYYVRFRVRVGNNVGKWSNPTTFNTGNVKENTYSNIKPIINGQIKGYTNTTPKILFPGYPDTNANIELHIYKDDELVYSTTTIDSSSKAIYVPNKVLVTDTKYTLWYRIDDNSNGIAYGLWKTVDFTTAGHSCYTLPFKPLRVRKTSNDITYKPIVHCVALDDNKAFVVVHRSYINSDPDTRTEFFIFDGNTLEFKNINPLINTTLRTGDNTSIGNIININNIIYILFNNGPWFIALNTYDFSIRVLDTPLAPSYNYIQLVKAPGDKILAIVEDLTNSNNMQEEWLEYDINTDNWTTKTTMPLTRMHSKWVTDGSNILYRITGRDITNDAPTYNVNTVDLSSGDLTYSGSNYYTGTSTYHVAGTVASDDRIILAEYTRLEQEPANPVTGINIVAYDFKSGKMTIIDDLSSYAPNDRQTTNMCVLSDGRLLFINNSVDIVNEHGLLTANLYQF